MFKEEIKMAIKNNWKETATWLWWILLGSLFPVWGGIFIFLACKKSPAVLDFTGNGQFIIYSSTVLASAFYIVLKDYKTKFSGRNLFGTLCFLGLAFSTLLFSLVTASEAGKPIIELDRTFIQNFSLFLYLISLILIFLLTNLDKEKLSIDLRASEKMDIKKLDKDLEKLDKKLNKKGEGR